MTLKTPTLKKNYLSDMFSSCLCLSLATLMILLGENIKKGVISGLSFSFMTLIPTLFPFFILSDLWTVNLRIKDDGIIGRTFERLFGINASALPAFLSGLICGFPIGVKSASALYSANKISKDEFERLAGFANNPSLAFIVSGVGVGIFDDIYIGILLYVSIIISSVIVGTIFSKSLLKQQNSTVILRQSFNLVNSIKNAGMTSIAVASYIVFFSGIIGVCESFIKNEIILSLISSLLEVGSTARLVGEIGNITQLAKLAITAFAIGYSGLSVHLQALSFFPDGASFKKYFIMKLIQGVLSVVVIIPIYLIFK